MTEYSTVPDNSQRVRKDRSTETQKIECHNLSDVARMKLAEYGKTDTQIFLHSTGSIQALYF